MPERDNIELRSPVVQELMGNIPSRLVRWGSLVLVLILVLFIVGGSWFQYPDVRRGRVVITSSNPPAKINSRTNGRILEVLIEDGQKVEAGNLLMVLENTADYNAVYKMYDFIIEFGKMDHTAIMASGLNIQNAPEYGPIQSDYAAFAAALDQYTYHFNTAASYYSDRSEKLNNRLRSERDRYRQLEKSSSLAKEKYQLEVAKYERDSSLVVKGVKSQLDLENSRQSMIREKDAMESASRRLIDSEIELASINEELSILNGQQNEAEQKVRSELWEKYNNLLGSIKAWEQTYMIIAPVEGEVSFSRFWSRYQNVSEGDIVLTIVPSVKDVPIGKMYLPVPGSGKVDTGQTVLIKLDNYPHMEYGMLKGTISNMSTVPEENTYMLEIKLSDGLMTNYGKELALRQEMSGEAEIITQKRSFMQTLLEPIRSAIQKSRIDQ